MNPPYGNCGLTSSYAGARPIPSEADLRGYLKDHENGAVAIMIRSSDNIFASEWHVDGYHTAFVAAAGWAGRMNGKVYGFNFTDCVRGMLLRKINETYFVNCNFETEEPCVITIGGAYALFNNCTFTSAGAVKNYTYYAATDAADLADFPDAAAMIDDQSIKGDIVISFQSCSFNCPHRLYMKNGEVTYVGNTFTGTQNTQVDIQGSPTYGMFAGNTHGGTHLSEAAVTWSGSGKYSVTDEWSGSVVPTFDTVPHYDYTLGRFTGAYDPVRKPGADNLRVAYSSRMPIPTNASDSSLYFEVTADGSTDDSAAIQTAIDAVDAAGGGIVLLPRLADSDDTSSFEDTTYSIHNSITVPKGIELRGTCLGMPNPVEPEPKAGVDQWCMLWDEPTSD